ncbi:hypothetical protein B0H11DRAFT_433362 [Mycena galericulata]|nr:hypothetical protein B0H11DRAFT_433362 [Mycena galericulata]
MEDNLRKLVLRSQKSKNKPVAPMTTAESVGSSSPGAGAGAGAGAPPSTQPPPAMQTTAPTTEFSLDDLAVSFITETIQTLVPNGAAPLPPPPPKTVAAAASKTFASTTTTTSTSTAKTTTTTTATSTPSAPPQTAKEALAARQKRLEAQIKESKELMAQLAGARNRGEKERILGLMRERERSRCVASLLFRNGARRRRGRACLLSAFFLGGV